MHNVGGSGCKAAGRTGKEDWPVHKARRGPDLYRVLRKVKVRTPVDRGRLRDSWRIERVYKDGTEYVAEIINSMEYASYVENGHRQEPGRFVPAIGKRLVKSYVPGKYMLRISEQEVQKEADKFVQNRIEKALGDLFG